MSRRMLLVPLALAATVAAGCGSDSSEESGAAPSENASAAVTEREAAAAERAGGAAAQAGKPAARPNKRRGTKVKIVDSQFGRVVADGKGEAIYLFDKEKSKRSRCYGACARAWPPLLTKGKPRAGKGVKAKLLGTTRRRNGKLQVTYAGQPLYYYVDDRPGLILCHDVSEFGGLWLVVKPNGQPA